jgi:hypothetical protein
MISQDHIEEPCHGAHFITKVGKKTSFIIIEEEKLVNYIYDMARYGHPLNLTELRIKVAKATQYVTLHS